MNGFYFYLWKGLGSTTGCCQVKTLGLKGFSKSEIIKNNINLHLERGNKRAGAFTGAARLGE
jgi:hypothetical protein